MEGATVLYIPKEGIDMPPDVISKDKELVQRFYKQERKKDVEEYAKTVQEKFLKNTLNVKLYWSQLEGLVNISIGHGGLDLESRGVPGFQEHNLGWTNGFIAGAIAQEYVWELLKCRD